MIKFLSSLSLLISLIFSSSPLLAHDYMAPYLYLSGIYSPTGKPISYPVASESEMTQLLQQIKNENASIRAIAAGALGQTNNQAAVEPLITALSDTSDIVRMNATMAFFHIKSPKAIEALKKILVTDRQNFFAVYSLAAQGDEGIDALMAMFASAKHNADADSTTIAEAVVMSKGADALKWASDKLNGSNKAYFPIAILVLRDLCYGELKDSVLKTAGTDKVTEILIAAAKDEDITYAKNAAIQLLFDIKHPSVKQLLKGSDSAIDEDRRAREGRRMKLSSKQVKQFASHIRKAKGKPDDYGNLDAREEAGFLADTTNPLGVPTLIKILNEKNATAAQLVVRPLAFSQHPKAIPALLPILQNKKHPAYRVTVEILGYLRNPAVDTKLLQSKDVYAVRLRLKTIEMSDRDLTKYIIPLLKRPDIKLDAALALATFKSPEAIDTLASMLSDSKHREAVMNALLGYKKASTDKILTQLKSSDPKTIEGAAYFFRFAKEPKAVDLLTSLMSSSNNRIRGEAIQALFFQTGPKTLPCYSAALKDTDSLVRKQACYYVALSPDAGSKDALRSLLKDNNPFIQKCAAIALGQLGDKSGADKIIEFLTPKEDGSGIYDNPLTVAAIRAAGKLKDIRAVGSIVNTLGGDIKMSTFDGGTEEEMDASRTAKIEALESITGKDFKYAFYRWMAWSIAQGNKSPMLFPQDQPESYEELP